MKREVCGHTISFARTYELARNLSGRKWTTVDGPTHQLTCSRTPHILGTPHEATVIIGYPVLGNRSGLVQWTQEGRITDTEHPTRWPIGLLCTVKEEA